MKKTVFTLTLILTLVLTLLILPVSAAEDAPEVEYYGRAALSECENSTALLYAYDALTAGIASCSEEINVYNGTDAISKEEISMVIDVHRRDRADYFWIGNEYSISATTDADDNIVTVNSILPTYLFVGDALTAAKAEVEAEVEEILAGVTDSMTDYEKLTYLHDTLAGRIEYGEGEGAHNLYGALVLGKCVCEGYAESLQYLLHRVGVDAFLAIGSSYQPDNPDPVGHEWNYVKINDKWYHVDLTWDDQGMSLIHTYFCVTDAEILIDHSIDPTDYALPVCNTVIDCDHGGMTHVEAFGATCETDGANEHYACADCGRFFADALGNDEISRDEAIIPATGHSYNTENKTDEYLKEEGDCQIKATYWYSCVCGKSAGDDENAQDKFFEGELGDHIVNTSKWVGGDGEHSHACTVPGCTYVTDTQPCTGGTATCIELARCDTCGEPYGDLAEHTYDTEKYGYKKPDGHAHTCTVCGVAGEVTAHAAVEGAEATETEPLLCEACGYIITPALNHGDNHEPREEWQSDDSGHWHGCIGCEEQQLGLADHVDEDENGVCDVCEYKIQPKEESEPDPIVDPLPALIAKLTKDQLILGAAVAAALVLVVIIIDVVIFFRRRSKRW